MAKLILPALLILLFFPSSAQDTSLYIGGQASDRVIVSTSSSSGRPNWDEISSGQKTIDGSGLDAELIEASRFLGQATLGARLDDIRYAAEIGFEDWIEEQVVVEPSSYLSTLQEMYALIYDRYIEDNGDPNDFRCRPRWYHANYAWWQMIMTGQDLLRQRVALALSEIIVISKSSDLENYGYGVASFYDILIRNAFGNYRDVLTEIVHHPAMGNYLSHLNNSKAIPEEFIFPDENFGREFMQLFSLGIHELNIDGSIKRDQQGVPIPTYTDADIAGLSAVFTGLGAGAVACEEGFAPAFGLSIRSIDMTVPMQMYEEYHESGEKRIVGGHTITPGQGGKADIAEAIDVVFNHPNVGPFLTKKLIKLLIKSNPTPQYIERIAKIFNDNGEGVRGDMEAVIKAIFLDQEARDCKWLQDEDNGRLREPILRYTQFARAMDTYSPSGYYWNTGDIFYRATGQHHLDAPSVFNFFQPEFQPAGPLSEAGLTGPEFQLLNSVTGVEYFDEIYRWTFEEQILKHRETGSYDRYVYLDIYRLMGAARDPEVLINKIDLLLSHGSLSKEGRALLKNVLLEYDRDGISLLVERTVLALYFVMLSPDYLIFK